MGMAAILVMWPEPFEQIFVLLSQGVSIWNVASIVPVVSEEKMFENVDIQISPWKKLFLRVSPRNTPCAKKKIFAEKNKNHLFRREFSPRNFRRETPRDFAETLREILRWVGKDRRFLHANSEDPDQTEKLSKCPAWYESPLEGPSINSKSLHPQYNHRMCGHRGETMYTCNCYFLF